MTNRVQEYIKEKEKLYDLLLDFIDEGDDIKYHKLLKYFQIHKITGNYSEFKLFLRFLVILSNDHNRSQFFFNNIDRILQLIKDSMKKTFTESDLFDIFYTNKRFLLYLIQNKIIEVNNLISNFEKTNDILFKSYFYPELKDLLTNEDQAKINNQISNLGQDILDHFDEYRLSGENHTYISSLIRQDSVEDFIMYVNKHSVSLNKFFISPSLFESNSILKDNQKVTLIEYAAFYGSIEIFQYLLLNGCKLPSSLWKFAVHGRNAELIHKLEDNHIDGQDYIECVEESIKCYHNEIADYIINNLVTLNENNKKQIFSFAFKYQNYNIMRRTDINDIDHIEDEIFYNSCKFDYESIILIQIKNKKNLNFDFNKAFDFCCENDNMNITQIFLDNMLIQIDKFANCKKLKKIKIPSYINAIINGSFFYCSSLEEVTIPSSVKIIESYAFKSCISLKHVTIPSSVQRIENDCFRKCQSLTTITLPSTIQLIGKQSFENCISLKEIFVSDQSNNHDLIIEDCAFNYCQLLKQIPILSFCKHIGSESFNGCASLEKIIIPPSITTLQSSVFSGCKSITEITIPPTIKSIEQHAFRKCSSLKKVLIQKSPLTKINLGVFDSCSSLIEINIPPTVEEICKNAFYGCESIKKMKIPSSVKIIGESAFENCKLLTQINIPSNLSEIGSSAFKKCELIKQIKIPNSCKIIGKKVFSGCKSLEEVEIPLKIEIPQSIFKNCSSLKQFTIPSTATTINSKSFKGCSSLKELKIPSSVKQINNYAFASCSSIEQFEIPSSVTYIGDGAFFECSSAKQIIISSSFISIPDFCFEGCSSLVNMKLPDSIKYIGSNSFSHCKSLKKINIPPSVERIEISAFLECLSLEEVDINSSTEIDKGVFWGCPLLDPMKIKSKVSNFNALAFDNCNILIKLKQRKKPIYQLNTTNLNDYEFIKIISQNLLNSVVKAQDKKTRKDYVLKFYHKELPQTTINIFFVYTLTNLNIPGIVKIQSYRFPLQKHNYNDKNNYLYVKNSNKCWPVETSGYIVVKDYYKNGSLKELTEEYLKSNGSNNSILNPTIRSKIIFGVAAIMKKLHKLNIAHFNLTIGNILLDDNCEPLINNFNLAGFNNGVSFDELRFLDEPYFPEYALSMAPERIAQDKNCSLECDVFSYAIFVYLMFSTKLSFPNIKENTKNINLFLFKTFSMIADGNRYPRPNNIPDHYWELIQDCWSNDPNDRPSFDDITKKLRNDVFALKEFGNVTDLKKLHEYQNRIDKD